MPLPSVGMLKKLYKAPCKIRLNDSELQAVPRYLAHGRGFKRMGRIPVGGKGVL